MNPVARFTLFAVVASISCPLASLTRAEETYGEVAPQRIEEITRMLPAHPGGFGRPCADRATWSNPELQSLLGSSGVTGTVTVEDAFEFSKPTAFEVALPTRAKWRQIDPGTIELVAGTEKMRVEIRTPVSFDLTSETIEEQSAPPFARLGIRLKQPLAAGTVSPVFHSAN